MQRHFINLCVVECLDVAQVTHVALGDEVDAHALSSESSGPTDAVDVVFSVGGEVIVDDKGHLLHVNASRQEIRRDEDAR